MGVLVKNEPKADILINSMRSIGYSFIDSIADIIDNSISAHAKNITVLSPISSDEKDFVAIFDDGCGMDKEKLYNAMRFGSERNENDRTEFDLGRFGLGLKTASLSQCSELTVLSKKDEKISAYKWDLNIIKKNRSWTMIELSNDDIQNIKQVSLFDNVKSGTLVLWENFDLLEKKTTSVYAAIQKLMNEIEQHIALVFHRFINASEKDKVIFHVNSCLVEGLDPFLENHHKTEILRKGIIPLNNFNIYVQPYILPHQKDIMDDKAALKLSGGLENYKSKQGFYIYRNKRLITYGTWFGSWEKDELSKNARIKVDVPAELDDIWEIDIKKGTAKIPQTIRQQLKRTVSEALDASIRVHTYRGRQQNKNDNIDYIWLQNEGRNGKVFYTINRQSKIFSLVKDMPDEYQQKLEMVLEEIENRIPYQQIYLDNAQEKIDDSPFELSDRRADIKSKADILIPIIKSENENISSAIERLFNSEPFVCFPEIKEILLKEHVNGR